MKDEIGGQASRLSLKRKLIYSALPALLLFAFMEAGLRAKGFMYDSSYRYMRFGYPDDEALHKLFEPDPVTLWRLIPSYEFGAKISGINSLGFRGPETAVKKPEGVKRIVCMGDSVTFGAPETSYPEELSRLIKQKGRYEVINAGMPGFSSWQGLKLLEHKIKDFEPDVIIIAYGWNDGWLAFGRSDSEQRVPPKAFSSAERTLRKFRVYQALNFSIDSVKKKMSTQEKTVTRVPLEQFSDNVRAIVVSARAMGAIPALMMLPDAVSLGKMPDFFYYNGLIEGDPKEPARKGLERIRKIHDAYNDTLKVLADKENCPLIDVEKGFVEYGTGKLYDNPEKDIIHPNDKGYALMGRLAYDMLIDVLAR